MDFGARTFVLFVGGEKKDLASWSLGSLSVPAEVKKLRADVAIPDPTNHLAPRVVLFDPSSRPFLEWDGEEAGFV